MSMTLSRNFNVEKSSDPIYGLQSESLPVPSRVPRTWIRACRGQCQSRVAASSGRVHFSAARARNGVNLTPEGSSATQFGGPQHGNTFTKHFPSRLIVSTMAVFQIGAGGVATSLRPPLWIAPSPNRVDGAVMTKVQTDGAPVSSTELFSMRKP